MMEAMAQQLLVRDMGEDTVEFQAVEVAVGDDPFDLERPEDHVEVPQLGSQDLLRLASVLAGGGYRVVSVDVRDNWFRPLDEPESAELSDLLKSLIEKALISSIDVRGLLNGRVVNGVTLRDSGFKQVTISTNGLLTFHPVAASDLLRSKLLKELKTVWREQI